MANANVFHDDYDVGEVAMVIDPEDGQESYVI